MWMLLGKGTGKGKGYGSDRYPCREEEARIFGRAGEVEDPGCYVGD